MKNIKLILMAAFAMAAAVSCSDSEMITTGNEPEAQTIRLEIIATGDLGIGGTTRTEYKHIEKILKTYWCYGDELELIDDKNQKVATLKADNPKELADSVIVQEVDVKFVGYGSIGNPTNFNGKLRYKNPNNGDEKVTYYITQTDDGTKKELNTTRSELQIENNSIEHLKYSDQIEAELKGADLTKSFKADFKRKSTIFKAVLDGFIYPVWGGGIMRISSDGLVNLSDETKTIKSIDKVLGWGAGVENGYTLQKGEDFAEIPQGKPLVGVSANKEEITGYALRGQDDSEKLILYYIVNENIKIKKGHRIQFYLQTEWSRDAYVWTTEVYQEDKEFLDGKLYVFDFTKKDKNGEYLYTPKIAVEVCENVRLETMNVGANRPEEVGNYYVNGNYNQPVVEGGKFPKNVLVYDKETGAVSYNGINFKSHEKSDIQVVTFEEDESFKEKTNHFSTKANKWLVMESGDASKYKDEANVHNKITVEEYFQNGELLGYKAIVKRTHHMIFWPASGYLMPSKRASNGEIPDDAIAIKENETQGLSLTRTLKIGDTIKQFYTGAFKSSKGEVKAQYYSGDLDWAMPIRLRHKNE